MRGWLRAKRAAIGMTQSSLAQASGVSEQYIYYIEAGERRPSVEVAKKIAKTLGFDWQRFYEDEAQEDTSEEST